MKSLIKAKEICPPRRILKANGWYVQIDSKENYIQKDINISPNKQNLHILRTKLPIFFLP